MPDSIYYPQGQSAETQLAERGYKQELPRKLSMMSILGMSFAIMVRFEQNPGLIHLILLTRFF